MSKIQYAFRIVHIDNIPHILEHGLVHKNSLEASENYVSIGDTSVIETRGKRMLEDGTVLSDYIPFYFGPRSPMLYNIQHGYGFLEKRNLREIVYCVLIVQMIFESDLECVFSDGHALDSATKFYGKDKLPSLDTIVKYEDVYSKFWFNQYFLDDRKRRKEAELLIKGNVPKQYIRGFVVYDRDAYDKLISFGVPENMVCIKKEYYY